MLLRTTKLMLTLIIIEEIMAQVEFPEHFETDKKKSNLAGRIPLYSPMRCNHDELLYPGDQINDWICDCAPAALYHPDTDACYPAFRQGPCPAGQFLVLAPNSIIPECITNSCRVDGQISIHNVCYKFGEGPPCRNAHLSYVLGVDPATILVDCVKLSLNTFTLTTRFGEPEPDPNAPKYDMEKVNLCGRGTKRNQKGNCQPQ